MSNWTNGQIIFHTKEYEVAFDIVWTSSQTDHIELIELIDWQATIAFGLDFPQPPDHAIELILRATSPNTTTTLELKTESDMPTGLICYVSDIEYLFDSNVFNVTGRSNERFETRI